MIKKSYLIAAGLSTIIVMWLMSAVLFKDKSHQALSLDQTNTRDAPITVQVSYKKSKLVENPIVVQGTVMPNRVISLRAETEGRVQEILKHEGNRVSANEVIARLMLDDRQIRLDQATARYSEQKRKFESSQELFDKGLFARTILDEAVTNYKKAQAELELARLDIEHTVLRAPFAGIIDIQHVEVGDYVQKNTEIVTLVENDPLVVTVYVPQLEIARVQLHGNARVKLATGENLSGQIRFISPRAQSESRTFRTEIEIMNPDSNPSGISATVQIPTEKVRAINVSPALLSLTAAGETGIKTVNEDALVEFHIVDIVRAERDGIWVSGLPDNALVITVGQGFVDTGTKVSYQVAEQEDMTSTNPVLLSAELRKGRNESLD